MTSYNSSHHARHQAAYRQRLQEGLKPVPSPWSWLTLSAARTLATEAFRHAAYACSDASDPCCTPAFFASEFHQIFEELLFDAAHQAGVPDVPACFAGAAARLRAELPPDWSHQYPVYACVQEGSPA